jgi:glyoxylase-like metal-dependent hydrolase (beta-lactamase superfamily II)
MVINNLCKTCGAEYPQANDSPNACPICEDDRQYLPENGQQWTNYDELSAGHKVEITALTPILYSLKIEPVFALGQRALLVLSEQGNVLWDCIPLLDDAAIEFIKSKGGLKAIAFSHPHYYSTMNRWVEVFDCPVYIHHLDEQWVFNKGSYIEFWQGGEKLLWDGMKIVHTGGHFPGSCVLKVDGLSPKGTLLVGDSLYVARSKRHIAIMYSYPNQIPLPANELKETIAKVSEQEFDTMYGAFEWQNLRGNAGEVFKNSVERYQESCLQFS